MVILINKWIGILPDDWTAEIVRAVFRSERRGQISRSQTIGNESLTAQIYESYEQTCSELSVHIDIHFCLWGVSTTMVNAKIVWRTVIAVCVLDHKESPYYYRKGYLGNASQRD